MAPCWAATRRNSRPSPKPVPPAKKTDLAAVRGRQTARELAGARQPKQAAARETREAAAAVEAARVLADHPAQPLPIGLVQTDALGKLRAEQERVLREIEAERGETQAINGQRLT